MEINVVSGEHPETASSTDLRLHWVAVVPVVEAACAHLRLVGNDRNHQTFFRNIGTQTLSDVN